MSSLSFIFSEQRRNNTKLYGAFQNKCTTPEFIALLNLALERNLIDKDKALIYSISGARVDSDLITIALPLRYGANSNVYVKTSPPGRKTTKTIHMLAYVLTRLDDKVDRSLISDIMMLLIRSGSRITDPLYEQTKIERGNPFQSSEQTVKNWIRVSYPWTTKLDKTTTLSNKINLLLDLRSNDDSDIRLIIKYRSLKTFKQRINNDDTIVNRSFRYSTIYYNRPVFEELALNMGYMPPYTVISQLFSERTTSETLNSELDSMVISAADAGSHVDIYQSNIRNVPNLLRTYEQPRWHKMCKYSCKRSVSSGAEVRQMAFQVGIDPDEELPELCRQLENIAQMDANEVISMLVERQKKIIELKSQSRCQNPDIYGQTIYSFASLEHYTDKGQMWCFPSNLFNELLEKRINPYTKKELNESFIRRLQRKKDHLESLGINLNEIVTIEKGVENINRDDIISNKRTDKIVLDMESRLMNRGFSPNSIKNLGNDKYERILSNLGSPTRISHHGYVTFLMTCSEILENNKNKENELVKEIDWELREH
uniref:Uncharacterized protein n=1 Tax=Pithovirus LCPAC404 TaxID=2506597 RepID=A0A481ZC85_9VIRU|nr:MAG: hypothetical protein LCPAC404_02020 [Pithovirus LCPAC404]